MLGEEGQQINSIEFSNKLKKLDLDGKTIVLVIGGPFGLSEEVKQKADCLMSLSKMTFTHEMARLFLAEQLYRSFMIINNRSYYNK